MASVYKKGNKLYISWWDNGLGKTKNKSTGWLDTKENWKRAEEIARKLQDKLDKEKEESDRLGIKKVTLGSAEEHYLSNNNGKHKKTLYEYEWFFKRLHSKFDPLGACNQLTKLTAEAWINDIRNLSLQKNSKFVLIKNLKKFLNFLFEYNYLPYFKLNKDVLIRPEVKEIIIFSKEDISLILHSLAGKNSNFRTLIHTLLYTGLRPSDIYKITTEQIDLKEKRFRYHSEKTKQNLIVPIHKELLPLLSARIDEVKSGYIFEYANEKNIGKAFSRYLAEIGLSKKGYNLRTFRKSFISYAYDSNIDLAAVSKLVGHKNIKTTATYYHKLSISRQTDELDKLNLKLK